jgi:uncharacterized lipoprotein YehR (DUF1307 family)
MATSTKLLTPIFAMVFALSVAACERQEGPAEEAGKKIDRSMDAAGEKMKGAGEKIKDAAEDAKDAAKKATH